MPPVTCPKRAGLSLPAPASCTQILPGPGSRASHRLSLRSPPVAWHHACVCVNGVREEATLSRVPTWTAAVPDPLGHRGWASLRVGLFPAPARPHGLSLGRTGLLSACPARSGSKPAAPAQHTPGSLRDVWGEPPHRGVLESEPSRLLCVSAWHAAEQGLTASPESLQLLQDTRTTLLVFLQEAEIARAPSSFSCFPAVSVSYSRVVTGTRNPYAAAPATCPDVPA